MNKFDYKLEKGFVKFEKKFFSSILLYALAISILGLITNFFMKLDHILLIIPAFTSVLFLFSYKLVKKDIKLNLIKTIATIFTILILNLLWYYNYGYRGPAPYFFVIIYSVLIYLWHGNQLKIITGVFVANIITIFYLDLYFPNLTHPYPTVIANIQDTYIGIFIYITLLFIVVSEAKNNYTREYQKAKDAEKLMSAFLANMSHEIRTPLNAIIGFSNILAESELEPETKKEYAELISSNNKYLLQLITDILDISKIEANQFKYKVESINISKEVMGLRKTFEQALVKAEKGNIKLNISVPETEFKIDTDVVRFHQILNNIFQNALKFTEEGKIDIKVEVQKNNILLTIEDTGIGIEAEKLEKIFDRFYRIENSSTQVYRGTGLGLYLTKLLVEDQGGQIWVISEQNIGSKFYITLPKNNYVEIPKEIPIEPVKIESNDQQDTDFKKLNLLIVEDDYFNQLFYIELFKQYNMKVEIAISGEEAMHLLSYKPKYDVILLDIKLPGMDGYEVLKNLQEMKYGAKVIAQTANAMSGDRQKCLEAGFDYYISKPIDPKVLEKTLKEIANNLNLS